MSAVTGFSLFRSSTFRLTKKQTLITVKPEGGAADDIVDLNELGRNHPKKALQDYDKALDEIHKGNNAKAIDILTGVVTPGPGLLQRP